MRLGVMNFEKQRLIYLTLFWKCIANFQSERLRYQCYHLSKLPIKTWNTAMFAMYYNMSYIVILQIAI